MVKNNELISQIENKKPVETVYELKNEIPSFEEFMKTYESDENLNYDDLSGGDISSAKHCGSMYRDGSNTSQNITNININIVINPTVQIILPPLPPDDFFDITLSLPDKYLFAMISGTLTSKIRVRGSRKEVHNELWQIERSLENKEIKVVKSNALNYERNINEEEKVRSQVKMILENI